MHQQGEEQLHVARLEEEGEELLLGWGALEEAVDHLQSPTHLQGTARVSHRPPSVPPRGLGTLVTHLQLVLCCGQVAQQALHLLRGEAPAEEILHQAEEGHLHRPDVIVSGRGIVPGGAEGQREAGMCPLSPPARGGCHPESQRES